MFNLNEEWMKAYDAFLLEESSEFDNDLDAIYGELTEAQDQIKKGFDTISEFIALTEADNAPVGSGNLYTFNTGVNYPKEEKNEKLDSKPVEVIKPEKDDKADVRVQGNLVDMMRVLKSFDNDEKPVYKQEQTYTVQKISDMKFPGNLIFFIKQLIVWIKNVVVYFIEKILNIFRRLTGGNELKLDPRKLKLELDRAKTVEQITTFVNPKSGNNGVVKVGRIIDSKDIDVYNNLLKESFIDDIASASGISLGTKEPNLKKEKVIVTVDLSRDLSSLKEMIQHFYDLFDRAYGSNNEKLFDTDDLEVILKIFKTTLDRVKDGNPTSTYTISGNAYEVSPINSARVKENLILTNTNITNLKSAYVQTSAKVKDIGRIINSKEMLMLSDMGADYKMLTSSTLAQINLIIDTIPARLKEAEKLQKNLEKMKKEYLALSDKLASLQKMTGTYGAIGNVSYASTFSRQIVDLTNAAKYMTDIVTLRLSGLGLYIQELKSIKDTMEMLLSINGGKEAPKRKFFLF